MPMSSQAPVTAKGGRERRLLIDHELAVMALTREHQQRLREGILQALRDTTERCCRVRTRLVEETGPAREAVANSDAAPSS